nr:uncharacterized protein LOC115117208 [Oncorhynchus nerka]
MLALVNAYYSGYPRLLSDFNLAQPLIVVRCEPFPVERPLFLRTPVCFSTKEKGPNMALVFSLSTLMFLITGTETSKSLSQGPELKPVIQVDSGKDAVLECSVNFNGISPGNVNIEKVVWWRLDQNGLHKGEPVFKYNLSNQQSSNPRMQLSPKYQLSVPPANEKDKVVSLLVKETQTEDEGLYRCVVNTDSGVTNCNFMLNVTGNLTGQLKAFGVQHL